MPRPSPIACFVQAWKSCNGRWGLITLTLIVYGIITFIGLGLGGVYNLLVTPIFDFTLSILFLQLVRIGTGFSPCVRSNSFLAFCKSSSLFNSSSASSSPKCV